MCPRPPSGPAFSHVPERHGAGGADAGVGYTQVSIHIRDRHCSIGMVVPVYRGQK